MKSDLVLITGATGHIGFRTLIHTLSAGYTVRCAVRSAAKAQILLAHPSIQALNCNPRLSFVIVPDLLTSDAYDQAVCDVKYIIHIASPLMMGPEVPLNEQDKFFIQPAVRGTVGMLRSAKKAGSVHRIVITSSITALIPLEQLTGEEPSTRCIKPTDRIPFHPEPYESEFAAYAASKVAALAQTEAWIARNNPSFDVVHLHPGFVLGRNDLATTPREVLKGTNSLVLGLALGKQFDAPIAGLTVHNEDVARVHVQALNTASVPGNRGYILSQPTNWEAGPSIITREFSDAVTKRVLPNCGSAETTWIQVDNSETEEVFGFNHAGFEEQVESVVGHYLELRMKRRLPIRNSDGKTAVARQVRASA